VDALLQNIPFAPIHDVSLRAVLAAGLVQFQAFTLVLVRLSGLMIVGPLFGQTLVPANLRVLIVLTLSLLVTPTLADQGRILFTRLDANGDGLLAPDEVPDGLRARYERCRQAAGDPPPAALSAEQFRLPLPQPRTLLDYAWIAAGELGLGLVLGLGVLTILSGMQLAGDLIDQQTGLALGEIANPGLDITGSVTGHFLFSFATTILLVMEPTGYHLKMVSALVETFRAVPLGEATVTAGTVDLLRDLVHQSLVLGVQIAAPLLASMSLIALTLGFLGHTVPQINILVLGFPIRAAVSLVVLLASLSGIAKSATDVVPHVIDTLRHALAGY
jgi:flagellar biosynthetic protein FliR